MNAGHRAIPQKVLLSGLSASLRITALFLCATTTSVALGESVSYEGRAFSVDKLEKLPGDQVAVEVSGQSFLVGSQSLGQRVFRVYAEQPELLPERSIDEAYGGYVASIALKGAKDDALLALQRVIKTDRLSDSSKAAFVAGVAGSQGGGDLIVESLRHVGEGAGERRGGCRALLSLPAQSADQARKLLASDLSWASQSCPRELVNVAQEALLSGDDARGSAVLAFIASFFQETSEVSQAAKASNQRLLEVKSSIESSDVPRLEIALAGGAFDPLLRDYYQKSRARIVTEFCDRAASQRNASAVLGALSILDFSERNNRHHELALWATQELRFDDSKILDREPVTKMLWAYASKDPELKEAYLKTLSSFVEEAGDSDSPNEATKYLDLLRDIRPDPSPENDSLRGELAESLLDRGDMSAAVEILRGVRTELPWVVRFRLVLKSDSYALIMVLLGCVVVLRWIVKFFLRRRQMARRNSGAQRDDGPEGRQEGDESARQGDFHAHFADASLSKSAYKGLDEYMDCLAKFELEVGASRSDIKNAYRAVVKALHPDMNPRATKSELNKFIELTKTYERLLVLHEEREKNKPQ